jgi:hypothetical protein
VPTRWSGCDNTGAGRRHLWDSYKIAGPVISKTYAPSGTSRPTDTGKAGDPRSDPNLIHRNTPYRKRADVPGNKREWRTLMWDVVMLALGLGFFAAGIGYAYVCERL